MLESMNRGVRKRSVRGSLVWNWIEAKDDNHLVMG